MSPPWRSASRRSRRNRPKSAAISTGERSGSTSRGAKPSSASPSAPSSAIGRVASPPATRPPAARVRGDRLLEPGLARRRRGALAGSSSSHSGAGAAISRASASRRRWPADSQRHGQSATRSRAKAARALDGRRRARQSRPRIAAQKARVSRGVMAGFTRILMADIMQRARDARRDRAATGAPPQRAGRRPAQQRRRAAAAGSTCRCRWRRSAPARRPAARRNEPGKDQPLAAPAGEILGDQIGGSAGSRTITSRRPVSGAAKRRLRRGNPEPLWPPADTFGRVRGLGDKPVRVPYA